ncbi:MAG: hypothetical protein ACPLYD_14215, partial [Anaerolineae bacterium]
MHRIGVSLWTLLSLLVNLLAPVGMSAASSLPGTEYAIRSTEALPAWFTPDAARASGPSEILPSWFASAPATRTTEHALRSTSFLPAWGVPHPAARSTEYGSRNPSPQGHWLPADHHTIHAVTVTGPDGPINNCDVVTFTIVAANDAVTTTGVLITSTMPAGFTPTQVVFNVGTVGPNEVITRHAVFSATCAAVSGQNVVTLTQDGAAPIVRYTDFVVNPGAITVRKEPAVIPAGLDDVVTWTVYVENTGYGTVS